MTNSERRDKAIKLIRHCIDTAQEVADYDECRGMIILAHTLKIITDSDFIKLCEEANDAI